MGHLEHSGHTVRNPLLELIVFNKLTGKDSQLDNNLLSGTLPGSWAGLSNLSYLYGKLYQVS
jgi:hypothetical protein